MWSDRLHHKVAQYSAELRTCMLMGTTLESRYRLALDTCRFHLANGIKARPMPGAVPQSYKISIGSQLHDLQLRQNGGDFFIFHEIFQGDCYHIPQSWRDGVNSVVDLGANIGLTTLFFTRYFPLAHFVCVEPDPTNVRLLLHNLANLGKQALVVEGAISDRSGEVGFSDGGWSWGGAIIQDQSQGRRVRSYNMREIIALIPAGTIDILKVDVEGEERNIFADSRDWLQRVGLIVIELHHPYSLDLFRRDIEWAGFQVVPPESDWGNHMVFAFNRDRFATAGTL